VRLGVVKSYPLLEAEIKKGGCVEMRVGKCMKYLKVEEIGDIDIYDANATIMNRVTFIFDAIYNRKTIVCSLSINYINDKFSDVYAETTFHNDD
jgi:hypothetical protein